MSRTALNDCFAHDRRRLPAGEALSLLEQRVRPVVGRETVPVGAACGRFLAETVISPRNVPGFDNVAVDGFAFAHADLSPDGPSRLRLLQGRAAAGHPHRGRLPQGSALRVLTGAPLPEGADTVLMQEDVSCQEDTVLIPPGARRGRRCSSRGCGCDRRTSALP
jgi:molybdopterin molybdotransferase